MLVKAIRKGYFGLKVRNKGDKFEVKDKQAFSSNWMEEVKSASPAVTVGVEFDGEGNVVKPEGNVVKPEGDVVKPEGDEVKPVRNGGLSYKGKR